MKTCILMLLLLFISISSAKSYSFIGNGASSCGSWTAGRKEVGEGKPITASSMLASREQQWVLGFLSGIGFISTNGDDPLSGTGIDADAVWGWVDNYCRTNPLKTVNDAASAFYFAHPR